jgi:hypothetical protein
MEQKKKNKPQFQALAPKGQGQQQTGGKAPTDDPKKALKKRLKRKLKPGEILTKDGHTQDKDLLGGTKPDVTKWDPGFEPPKGKHLAINDYITKEGIDVPTPVQVKNLQEISVYDAKKKKKDKIEEQDKKQKFLRNDKPQLAYDPNADFYVDAPYRSDYDLFMDYYTMTKKERGLGQLAGSIDLQFFDVNVIKRDYTLVFAGRRGSGKTFLMRWILYHMRKCFPRGLCFTRTRVNKFWQTMMPDR